MDPRTASGTGTLRFAGGPTTVATSDYARRHHRARHLG